LTRSPCVLHGTLTLRQVVPISAVKH